MPPSDLRQKYLDELNAIGGRLIYSVGFGLIVDLPIFEFAPTLRLQYCLSASGVLQGRRVKYLFDPSIRGGFADDEAELMGPDWVDVPAATMARMRARYQENPGKFHPVFDSFPTLLLTDRVPASPTANA